MRASLGWWIALIAAIGALAAVGGVIAANRSSGDWADLSFEVAKAGVQVVAVGVAGGALAAAWRGLTARRETAAETREKIRAEFAELIVLYNGVKTVRRTLRSLGLDAKLHIDPDLYEGKAENYFETEEGLAALKSAGQAIELTKEQADGFHEQMQTLNRLQLGYEAKKRQFRQADLLGHHRSPVADTLEAIESYLNELVDLWEEHGWEIRAGTQLDVVSPALQPLYRQLEFKPRFSEPMKDITEVISVHLFGAFAKTDSPGRKALYERSANTRKAGSRESEHAPSAVDHS